jgi:hypothetical protein
MNMPSLIFFFISAEQDFLRSSFVTDESNMIQGAPSASHLESPHLGVDLMEGIPPNLSFNHHFGMDVNHQHQVPNQPRMLPSNFLQVFTIQLLKPLYHNVHLHSLVHISLRMNS